MAIWRLVVSRFLTTDYLLVDIVSGWFNWSYSFWKLTGRMFRDNGSTHEIVSLTQWHELAAHRRWLFDTVQGWSPRRREDSRSIAEIIWAASILTCFSIFRPLLSLSLSLSPSIFVSFVLCAPRSFFPRFRYVTLLSIHFRPPSLSFLAFARPGTTLRAVCIRTLDDYLLLPFPRNYFQPVASVRPLYVQDWAINRD